MTDLQLPALGTVSAVVLLGSAYSVLYGTYLDTSNPLLTHLPHPLHETHYWADKSNFLNVFFIKKAWGWTSLAFLSAYFTSAPRDRTPSRLAKYAIETSIWLVFTSWFFGPALLERVIVASGGECVLSLPSGSAISLPEHYCHERKTITPESHPDLFGATYAIPSEWGGKPRLRRGHDISGHLFLLTMSILFLTEQIQPLLRLRTRTMAQNVVILGNIAIIGVSIFACYTTSVYFHTPLEKINGLILGFVSYYVSTLPDSYFQQLSLGQKPLEAKKR